MALWALSRFPGHEEALRYLEAFAWQFDLLRLVRFETEVLSVRREDDGGRWAVTSRKLGEKGSSDEEFYDAVVVCNGHYTEPRIAVIPGNFGTMQFIYDRVNLSS